MLDSLLRQAEVRAYLNCFPREDWTRCVVATLKFGIRCAKQTGISTGNVQELEERLDGAEEGESMGALKQKMMSLKRDLETMSRDLSGFDGNVGEGKGKYEDRPRKPSSKVIPKRDKSDPSLKKPSQSRISVPQVKSTASAVNSDFRLPKGIQSMRNLDLPRVLEPRTNDSLVSHISEQTSDREPADRVERRTGFMELADEFLGSPLVQRFL